MVSGVSGIMLRCKKRFGQYLLKEKPLYIINDRKIETLEWNKQFLISLEPSTPYKITIKFPYLGQFRGAASFEALVGEHEIQEYEYTTPGLMAMPGSIELKE